MSLFGLMIARLILSRCFAVVMLTIVSFYFVLPITLFRSSITSTLGIPMLLHPVTIYLGFMQLRKLFSDDVVMIQGNVRTLLSIVILLLRPTRWLS